jgi:two-component system chemotaxis response regulator CheB
MTPGTTAQTGSDATLAPEATIRPAGPAPYDAVVIAASIGGVQALSSILSLLPVDFPVPIAVVLHRTTDLPNLLPEVLGRSTRLRVKLAEEGEVMVPGMVYLAPPNLHMTIRADRAVHLFDGRRIRHVRSSANPLFSSAAEALKGRVIAVVLTGGDADATDGVQTVRGSGGIVLAQDRATSVDFSMPHSAIKTGSVAQVLPLEKIGPALIALLAGSGPTAP